MADTPFNARNGLVANGLFTANSTQFGLGNVVITPTTVTVTTATGNVVINSSGVFVGNSTVNTTINSTSGTVLGVNTVAQYTWTNTQSFNAALIANNSTFKGTFDDTAVNYNYIQLTDAATINWNAANTRAAFVQIAGNRTMAAPTNLKVGSYLLFVVQDGVGSRTVTWNAVFKWVQGTPPVLTTPAGRIDMISFFCDGASLYGTFAPDMR